MKSSTAIILFFLSVLPSCAVRSTQLDGLRHWASTLGNENNISAEYVWNFEFNGAGYFVYPISERGGTVTFANSAGLRLVWDGSAITAVDGLPGATGEIWLELAGSRRSYPLGDGTRMWFQCDPRRTWQLSPESWGWREECTPESGFRGVVSRHEIEFDSRGNVRLIRGTLIPGAPQAKLWRDGV
jgi:hypothetical protein